MTDPRPLVIHVVYSFDVGGLENGIVNLLNHMPAEQFRHMVVALTRCAPGFTRRVRRTDVEFVSLNKPAGHGFKLYPLLFRMFRELRPAIVHTRNLAALEMIVPAWLAGVPVRIHGEHGWDNFDRDGTNRTYQRVRRLYSVFVSRYVALSRRIESYLHDKVGIGAGRVRRICNGVDARRFVPGQGREPLPGSPFNDPSLIVFGAVGRLQAVKGHADLIRAFGALVRRDPEAARGARLAIVGGGPLQAELTALVGSEGVADKVWFAGERNDIPETMRAFDVFVQPSISEGISNTLLEAMASGLPVIATEVGGNPELVDAGRTGLLVRSGDIDGLAAAMGQLYHQPDRSAALGRAGRERVLAEFSLDAMVGAYMALYHEMLSGVPAPRELAVQSRKALRRK